jgi:peptidoglycan/xylan/chitin deacetylase (PgdA/CDA1 family)
MRILCATPRAIAAVAILAATITVALSSQVVAQPPLGDAQLVAGGAQPALGSAQPARVAVLIYHQVDAARPGPYTVSPARLRDDLRWLLSRGWLPLSLGEFEAWMRGRRELQGDWFLLTFDDGYEAAARQALPVLKELGVPAVVFLSTALMGRGTHITPESAALLARSGLVSLQSHTHDLHRTVAAPGPKASSVPVATVLGAEEIVADLDRADQIVAQVAGALPFALAWPFGAPGGDAGLAAASRYALVFGASDGFVRRGEAALIPRFGMDYRGHAALRRLFR